MPRLHGPGAIFFSFLIASFGIFTMHAQAESLADALSLAYQSNPTLQAQRAQLRALDETNVQARAGWRPTATAQVGVSHTGTQGPSFFGSAIVTSESNAASANLSITQPLYTGGRTAAEVRATEFDVLSARETLRLTESTLLLNVITAYSNVIRDQKILKVREDDVALLQTEVDDAHARLTAGEVTKTDVAQTETQLASSRTQLVEAQGQLQLSRASYTAFVGQNPGELVEPPPLAGVPASIDDAFDVAEQTNPTIRQAQLAEQASRARVSEARAAERPSIGLNGTLGYSGVAVPFYAHSYERQIVGSLIITQPLLTGGINQSNIRRALELNNSDRITIESARRSAVQSVSQAWNTLLTSRSAATSEELHVQLARSYFTGTQLEFTVGLRTTLDIIIAEQNLRDAQVTLIQVQSAFYVANAQLLSAIGRLEIAAIVENAPIYDPAKSYNQRRALSATPWESLVSVIDNFGEPASHATKSLSAPVLPKISPALRGPNAPIPTHAAPALTMPIAPFPNTTSPSTPLRFDSETDATFGRSIHSATGPE